MANKEFFIEKRPDGRFNISKPNAARPSAVTNTQTQGIAKAKELDPDAAIHVARVRNIGPGPDKWRKL